MFNTVYGQRNKKRTKEKKRTYKDILEIEGRFTHQYENENNSNIRINRSNNANTFTNRDFIIKDHFTSLVIHSNSY